MTYETLQYVDGSGTTQEVALSLANVANVRANNKIRYTPRTHAASEFSISWAQPPETPIAIPFKSRCKIFVNRTSSTGAANSFSAGTCIFQGRRWDNEGSVSAAHVDTTLTLLDVWKDLEQVMFAIPWKFVASISGTPPTTTYSDYLFPDVVLFQGAPSVTYDPAPSFGNLITTWQQLQDIVNYAINYATGADAVQIQLAGMGSFTPATGGGTGGTWTTTGTPEFTPLYTNRYPVKAAKCAECINLTLAMHPGVYLEIDYTTTPPTLHARNRSAMTSVTLPYKSTLSDGTVHLATEIKPLDELVPDSVRIWYKVLNTVGGSQVPTFSSDIYPSGAGNSLLAMDFSVDITGSTTQQTIKNFTSTAFDPTNLALWEQRVTALKSLAQGGQIPSSGTGQLTFINSSPYNSSTNTKGIQVIGDDGRDYSTSFGSALPYLTDDSVYAWFALSGGTAAAAVKCTVKAFFSYNKTTTTNDKIGRAHV